MDATPPAFDSAIFTKVCAWCRKVPTPIGWQENRRRASRAGAFVTHGICPDCLDKFSEAWHESVVLRHPAAKGG